MPRGKSVKERFDEKWELDPDTGCWEWTAGKRKGYGAFKLDGRMQSAHRAAWLLYRGEIPRGEGAHGTCVCHTCDNRLCVNPEHLFLGTQRDNVDDKMKKGRHRYGHPKGSKHGSAKLTEGEVFEIRRLANEGDLTQREIGALFGITHQNVSDIKLRKIWNHV